MHLRALCVEKQTVKLVPPVEIQHVDQRFAPDESADIVNDILVPAGPGQGRAAAVG